MKKHGHKKQKVIVLCGPTGTGKTGLSIRLAKRFKGEIISADSRQVYRGLTIGTEKVSKKEMRGVHHHLIDVANPAKVFTASDFRKAGRKAIREIQSRNHIPFIVGGTGFYIDALVRSHEMPAVPPNTVLRRVLEKKGAETLHRMLLEKDRRRGTAIDKHNRRRLIRALEIVEALGQVPKPTSSESSYEILWIGLAPDSTTYQRSLAKRLDTQLKKGLLREIQVLKKKRVAEKRIQELGLEYRTGLVYLKGQISKSEMREKMLTELRQYAKRQMTWFKRNKDITWLDLTEDRTRADKLISAFLADR